MARTGGDGPRGISAFIVEKGTPGLSFGAERGEDGLERAAHRAGHLRRRSGACRRDARRRRRRGHRLRHRDERPQRRPASTSPHARWAARRPPTTRRRAIWPTGRRSAARCSTSPPSGSRSPTWPPRWRHREPCCGGRQLRSTTTTPTRWSCARWPSATSPTPASTSPIRRCSCTAATAISREYGLEKIVRDLRVHRILEGTNEIMRVVIGRAEAARARAQRRIGRLSQEGQ